MAIVYAVESGDDEDLQPVRDRLRTETWPDGSPVYTPLVCLSLMVFYIFAHAVHEHRRELFGARPTLGAGLCSSSLT